MPTPASEPIRTKPADPSGEARAARGRWLGVLAFALAAAGIATWVHFRAPNFYERDNFYHFRHAAIYLQQGFGTREFPWVTCSVIRTQAADLWYGFHVLLAPFTLARDPLVGMKLAGAAVLAGLLLLVYAVFRQQRISLPFLWPFVLLFAGPMTFWRLMALRPHVLSIGLLALALSSAARRRPWGVWLAALGCAFVHLTTAWLLVVVLLALAPVQRLVWKRWEWRVPAAGLAGILCGWMLRPGALGAARLLYVQNVTWAATKQDAGILDFPREMKPVDWGMLLGDLWPFLLLWVAASALFITALARRRAALPPADLTFLWGAFILSLVCFEGMAGLAGRFCDPWVCFATLFIAAVFTHFVAARAGAPLFGRRARMALCTLGVCAVVVSVVHTNLRDLRTLDDWYQPRRLQGVGRWLQEHSKPGEVVFHLRWWDFPELFFWNQQNRYIGGMDPIFQYAHSPARYWEVYMLEARISTRYTCASPDPQNPKFEETYTVLRRDFHASYIYVETAEFPDLDAYLRSDPRFILRYDEDGETLFQLR